MVMKKRAASKKAGKKTGKTALKRGRKEEVATAIEFGHSPIIITDGSASIQFGSPYKHKGNGHHTSTGIHLDRIEARANGAFAHNCHIFSSVPHRVEVVCLIGHVRTDITIEGANSGSSRPTINFDRDGHFKKDAVNFPLKPATNGQRFGNAAAKIISLRVINVSTGKSVHDCPLVPAGRFEYTIIDPH
jgi:hypothetical protein